jgi:hypothetical protein
MKKSIVFVLVFVFLLSFAYGLNAEGEKKLIKRPDPSPEAKQVDREKWEAKRDHLMKAKERKRAMVEKFSKQRIPADNPSAVDIQLDRNYTNWQSGLGDVYMTALCYNNGTSYAAMVEAEVTFYDTNQNYLGYDTGYVYGGTKNVQYGTAGYCTNELAPGEWGFFYVWPNVAYADAQYYSVTFTAENSTSYLWSNANLGFYGSVYYTDYLGSLDFYGDVQNTSYSYVTYYSEVHFAVFNTADTKVLDVDWTFVDGATYGTSSSAIYPRTYEPFDVWFLFCDYNQASGSYLSAFEWYEDAYSGGSESDPPFGSFATPLQGANVASSIAVTGWALDDSGVDSVKIYRGTTGNMTYIGDATFVEGARPDIAAAYPGYPNNTRAGWGYMLLTNFLPNGGNGTFTLYAVATDIYGKSTTLGSSTIHVDNANAVKPFGAIDTPTQGGDASGTAFRNGGWVLTPLPNTIPTNGSTINVYVDGVNLGHPNYNIYRSDIATYFPGYANSNGAHAYLDFNTTGYADGVHTIFWTAQDNAGNIDGIGSRFFNINNSSRTSGELNAKTAKNLPFKLDASRVAGLSQSITGPVQVKKGFRGEAQESSRIAIDELERVEIQLSNPLAGYLEVGGKLKPLPIGSTLDTDKGIFCWLPGAGFLGKFNLVFIEKDPNGELTRRNVTVNVGPEAALKKLKK